MMQQLQLPLSLLANAPPGRGIARLPMDAMSTMSLRPGDTVEITGSNRIYARVLPAKHTDNTIGVDEQMLDNLEAIVGHLVDIRPVPLQALDEVHLRIDAGKAFSLKNLKESLLNLPVSQGERICTLGPDDRPVMLSVLEISPGLAGLLGRSTSVTLTNQPGRTAYDDVGGLDEQIARIHEVVATPLLRPDLFIHLGISPPRGILFTGPPGTGKTLLARAIAKRTSAAFFQVNGPEIVSKHYGESEAALREVFETAEKSAPAIIFIDEIDAIAPKRDSLSSEKQLERRVVAQLLTLMDGLSDRGGVIVLAATNLPDSLDGALRRPGRFDREIPFTPPHAKARRSILDIHLARAPLSTDVDLDAIAAAAHGYVGADLAALTREASLATLARGVLAAGSEHLVRAEDLCIEQADLLNGLRATSPSALRETIANSPPINWNDIGGLESIKDALISAVVWPLIHQETFGILKLKPAPGVLLSGPPGTGKTLLARALATESGINFIAARPTQIMSQFLGEAGRSIAAIFSRARQSAPTMIFFDELDTLAPRRNNKDSTTDRIVAQLLMEIDGLHPSEGIIVLGATNRPLAIDPALLRAGRFELIIEIPLPDITARKTILDFLCRELPCQNDVGINDLAKCTEGFTSADLAALVNGASRHALRRALHNTDENLDLTSEDFDLSLRDRENSIARTSADIITEES